MIKIQHIINLAYIKIFNIFGSGVSNVSYRNREIVMSFPKERLPEVF